MYRYCSTRSQRRRRQWSQRRHERVANPLSPLARGRRRRWLRVKQSTVGADFKGTLSYDRRFIGFNLVRHEVAPIESWLTEDEIGPKSDRHDEDCHAQKL